MKSILENRRFGFYLAACSGLLAVVGAAAFFVTYMVTAGAEPDRVFNYMTLGMMLAGGIVCIAGEIFHIRIAPLAATLLCGVGLANHLVETAYPLADVLTGVPFFGGNFSMALVFAIIFILATVGQVVAAFMEHNK